MARNPGPVSASGEPPDDEAPENRRGDDESAETSRGDDASPENRRGNDERESIWSIPARLKRLYFGLFAAQVIAALVWLILDALADKTLDGAQAKILYIWQNMAPAAITSATFALVLTDGWNSIMVLSTWLEDELKKFNQRRVDAAVKKAVKRAKAEARAEENRLWSEWNNRREAAAAAGENFTELPPHYTPPPPY